jgi:3-oxoacyl-[acyl-carrier protein] reductase
MAFQLDFSNRVVLITGATRGIGATLAEDFHAAGASLVLTGTNLEQIAELNRAYAEAGVENIQYVQADFTDEESLQHFLQEISDYERIDVCINNAGINRNNPIYDADPRDYDRITQVNLRAPFLICRAVCGLMKKARYGRIVNIASIWGVITRQTRVVYSTTKFGLVGMTKSIAVDMAPFNVLANTVSPGFVNTELTLATVPQAERESLANQVPLKRFAEPSEISKAVMFLASDLNTYLTGQNIVVDGGFTSV